MQKITSFISSTLSQPVAVLSTIGLISISALLMALGSEAFLGLEPCILCIYQRVPFALVVLFAIIGISLRKRQAAARIMIALSGLTFLINSGIAFYHTGVEQKWWASFMEGCSVPAGFLDGNEQSMLENILSAPTGKCDEIPWADPILNLSMANYNVILCFGLFLVCTLSFIALRRKA